MIQQYLQLLRVLSDSDVTRTPRRVLAELKRQGKQRLPPDIDKSLSNERPGLAGLRFIHTLLAGEHLTRHNGQWVINSFLPPFPGSAFDRMFDNLLSGRRLSPVSAFLAVTGKCPLRCWHCSYKRRAEGELVTAQWLGIIESLHHLGASIIGFTGGEPTSRPDLPELVAAAHRGGAATIVFSSGTGIDPDLIEKLQQAGLWSLCVSLDHPKAEEHDRLRGSHGSHARACKAIRLARDAGFYTMAGTVATRLLVRNKLLSPLHELAGTCGAHEFRIVEPMPCGLLAAARSETLLTPDDIQAIRRFHVATNQRRAEPKVCAFNQIESPELFGCGAGTQHLFVDSAGEVCPCDFTPMSFGNAVNEPLETLWDRMSTAMKNPRRHCFIQTNRELLLKHSQGHFPLAPDKSLQVCAEAGSEPLPDYFQLVTGRKE